MSMTKEQRDIVATMRPFKRLGTTWRIKGTLVETNYGPENFVQVWSPVTHNMFCEQECMGTEELAAMIIDNLN